MHCRWSSGGWVAHSISDRGARLFQITAPFYASIEAPGRTLAGWPVANVRKSRQTRLTVGSDPGAVRVRNLRRGHPGRQLCFPFTSTNVTDPDALYFTAGLNHEADGLSARSHRTQKKTRT